VVNTTVFVVDISAFGEVNELFGAAVPSDPPARMTMQAPLPMGLLISIGCVAIVESDRRSRQRPYDRANQGTAASVP
jgi:hypothetical protein